MATSQNGWKAGNANELGIQTYDVPGPSTVKLALSPAAAPILLYMAEFWDANVEDIDVTAGHRVPDDWGFANRDIRGSSTDLSNHASGSAEDINATRYPRGTSNMTRKKKRIIRKELAKVNKISREVNKHDLLRWGGDYTRSPVDQMHIELADGTTRADVQRVMAVLERADRPAVDVSRAKIALQTKEKIYAPGAIVRIQRALRKRGLLGGYIPGRAGANTRKALSKYLTKRGPHTIENMTVGDVKALVGPTFYVHQ